jgi:UDP-N-acetyl-2-amino-2-deoxyglucuronate dehydrogenase
MTKPLGFAIIGCGMISEYQAKAIAALPDARVAGFFSQTLEKAQKRVDEFGGRVFQTLDEACQHPDVDAVTICTPSGAHLAPALAAAKAKKHVMVEKPIEITLERCDAIIQACRDAGVTLGAIFPRRFQESSRVLKQAIDGGRFGRVTIADVAIKWYRTQAYYDGGGWRGTWSLDGGGALMNQGIHGIDLLQWLMGGIAEVTGFTATLGHERIEVEDVASAAVRFTNGAVGAIEGTTASWPGAKIRIEIGGTNGSAVLEDDIITSWQFQDAGPADEEIRTKFGPRETSLGGGASDPRSISFEGHRLQFEDFVAAIRAKRRPFCDGADGRAAVAVITSIYRSAQEKRSVQVPD